jgi:hypothetical protein
MVEAGSVRRLLEALGSDGLLPGRPRFGVREVDRRKQALVRLGKRRIDTNKVAIARRRLPAERKKQRNAQHHQHRADQSERGNSLHPAHGIAIVVASPMARS